MLITHLLRSASLVAPSGRMRHVREVAAYNLPLRALFDKDQGGSAIGGYRLAVLGGTPKHVVSIHSPHNIVVNPAGWLPKTEHYLGDTPERRVDKLVQNRQPDQPAGQR